MSIAKYRYFFKVARLGSIREASEVLHVAPSAISRQIASLEEDLGVDLIEPNGRGIKLTPAGEILARHASQMVDSLEQARSQIDDLIGLRRGKINIWTAEGSVNDLVLPGLLQFQSRYPAVTYRLTVDSTDRIIRALLDDDADIGVAFNVSEHPELRPVSSFGGPLVVVGHPRHDAMQKRSMSLAELSRHPIALPDASFGLRHMIDAIARAAKVTLLPCLETNSIEALRAFARISAGLTVLPQFAVGGDLRRHLVRAVPLKDKSPIGGRTTVLVRTGRSLPVAVSEFAVQLSDIAAMFSA